MKIPTDLKHKPVIVVENYVNLDGRYAYDSDAQGLSLGLAQWSERGALDVSAKVWRHTGERWSRQSEELPLHRVLDLAILLCRAKQFISEESYRYATGYPTGRPVIDRIGLQGDAMTVAVAEDNEHLQGDLKLFADELAKEGDRLGERFTVLHRLLHELGY